MKKVFLSLAVIATLTVVSCKEKAAEAPAETTTTEEVVAPVEETPVTTPDTTAVESTTTTTEAPATETPAKK
jgi:hypothetical protein